MVCIGNGCFVLYHPRGLLLARPCKSGVWYTAILCMPQTRKHNCGFGPLTPPIFRMSFGAGLIAIEDYASLATTASNPTLLSYQSTFVCFMPLFDPSPRSHAMYGSTSVWPCRIPLILAILYPIPFLSLWARMRVGCMLLPGGDYLNHNSLPHAGKRETGWEPRQVGFGL